MNFTNKMLRVALLSMAVAFIVIFVATCSVQGATKRHATDSRERVMNETLTMVLEVGTDFRNQDKHPTWDEISNEVAKRMKLTRKPPWK